jgi:leader peptidase (prepilin peptidase)/N-methyltransferase
VLAATLKLLLAAGGAISAIALCNRLPERYGIASARRPLASLRNVFVFAACIAIVAVCFEARARGHGTTSTAVGSLLAVLYVVATVIDIEHMILPNEITFGATALALLTSPYREVGMLDSAVGAAIGLFLTYAPLVLYKLLRNRSGVGLGDAKLLLATGAWLGAEGAFFVVVASAIQSGACALGMRILGVEFQMPASVQAELDALRARAAAGDTDAKAALADDPMAVDVGAEGSPSWANMRLPLGPFIVAATFEFMIWKAQIITTFDRLVAGH